MYHHDDPQGNWDWAVLRIICCLVSSLSTRAERLSTRAERLSTRSIKTFWLSCNSCRQVRMVWSRELKSMGFGCTREAGGSCCCGFCWEVDAWGLCSDKQDCEEEEGGGAGGVGINESEWKEAEEGKGVIGVDRIGGAEENVVREVM